MGAAGEEEPGAPLEGGTAGGRAGPPRPRGPRAGLRMTARPRARPHGPAGPATVGAQRTTHCTYQRNIQGVEGGVTSLPSPRFSKSNGKKRRKGKSKTIWRKEKKISPHN